MAGLRATLGSSGCGIWGVSEAAARVRRQPMVEESARMDCRVRHRRTVQKWCGSRRAANS